MSQNISFNTQWVIYSKKNTKEKKMLLPTYLNLMHVNKIYLEAKSSSRFNTIQMQPFEMVLDIAILA